MTIFVVGITITMKKIILLIALLGCFCFKAEAQWIFGGGFGFGASSSSNFSLYIAPEVGYRVTNNFTVGGRMSYRSGYNQFGLDPYIRWDMFKPESPVRILASFHAPMRFASDYFSYGFYFQPGISVGLGGKARLECHIGAFGWGSVTSGDIRTSSWQATVNSNNVSVGVVFSI